MGIPPANDNWFSEAVKQLKRSGVIERDKEIGERIGYSTPVISKYLNGTVPVSHKFKEKFLSVYGVHLKGNLVSKVENKPETEIQLKDRYIQVLEEQVRLQDEIIKLLREKGA